MNNPYFMGDPASPQTMDVDQQNDSNGVAEQYSAVYLRRNEELLHDILNFSEHEQVDFVRNLMQQMSHYQLGQIDLTLQPLLQRDFISQLAKRGMSELAKSILGYLDADSLANAEQVCRGWHNVINEGMLWKAYVENQVKNNKMWAGLAKRRGWSKFLFRGCQEEGPKPDRYFRNLCPSVHSDIEKIEENWRRGRYNLQKINCASENSKGVYCLQYDDEKIVSGLRDNTIKIWDRKSLECRKTLTGHTGSVLCLQYNEHVIITGSSDSTVRVWNIQDGQQINTLVHHSEAVLHLRYYKGIMVTCSKDRSIAVWDMQEPFGLAEINMRKVLVGHRAAVNVVDFDEKYIVSASGDRTIKVWTANTGDFVRTLTGHRRGIACLQYRGNIVVSGSSDNTIRLWDIEHGSCLRTLEGHEELVRCIRFDDKRIVSGAYDGKIKIWDLKAALDMRQPPTSLCIKTLNKHSGRVFRLQFDEFQIISSSHDDTILIWDFLDADKDNDDSQNNDRNNDDGMAEDEDPAGDEMAINPFNVAQQRHLVDPANGRMIVPMNIGRVNRDNLANFDAAEIQAQMQQMAAALAQNAPGQNGAAAVPLPHNQGEQQNGDDQNENQPFPPNNPENMEEF